MRNGKILSDNFSFLDVFLACGFKTSAWSNISDILNNKQIYGFFLIKHS